MFRKMRRFKQQLSAEENIRILANASSGVLAVLGDDDYPYAVPLSYAYADKKIYFHCAKSGHKLDAIKNHAKVSFCVISEDEVVPEKFTSYFKSVVVFGKARILESDREIREAIHILGMKYSGEFPDELEKEIEKEFISLCCVEITIEHMTGKEAIELVKLKQDN